MIKGVNHQMIELTDVDSAYFDRAFFLLKPDCEDAETAKLHEEARRILFSAGGYSAIRRNRRRERINRILWWGVGMIIGIGTGLLYVGLFH